MGARELPPDTTKRVRIGISGWRYPPWRGVFYPKGLRQADELHFASRRFPSIEINGSFYSLMQPSSYREWYESTPTGFVFSVKGGRYVTHMKRLRDVEVALANFFASGVLALREKLGPILWQLPPSLAFEPERVKRFFELLPRSQAELARLAARHDERLRARSCLSFDSDLPVRHTVEVRHPSFQDERFEQLLREHGIAACLADSAGLYPAIDAPADDFAYLRLHGAETLYASGYSTPELASWAKRVKRLARTRDVFVYFDNDVKVRAPFDAQNLERLVNGLPPNPLPDVLAAIDEEPRTNWPAWRGPRQRASSKRA